MTRMVSLESNFLVPGASFLLVLVVLLLVLAVVGVAVLLLVRGRSASPRSGAGTSADRLRELQSLLDQGLITQDEYDARRRDLIAEV